MPEYATSLVRQEAAPRNDNTLLSELQRLGFGSPVTGFADRISVQDVTRGDADDVLGRLCGIASRGGTLCLSPVEFGEGGFAIETWQRFCEILRAAFLARNLATDQLGFCIHSHQLPLQAYCLIADSILGSGPRFVFLDSLQMETHCNRGVAERSEANWSYLWRRRAATGPLLPVYGGIVRSACPLLSDEVAAGIMPLAGLHVPANSAWLSIDLPLEHFADSTGAVDEERLVSALRRVVPLADSLFEGVDWPCPLQCADAKNNRRLAITLTGLGELVVRRGSKPSDLKCLYDLGRVVRRIRRELDEASVRMAKQVGTVPALARTCPTNNWPAGSCREDWRRRFETAVRNSALRHRNLLVMSPYAVLPAAAPYAANYTDLLPLIAYADAWCFAAPPAFAGWNITQFMHFHRRARAIIQGSHATSFVAAGV